MHKYTKINNYASVIRSYGMNEISINTEFIKLDSFLKWVGAVSLGSEAKMIIQDGEVLVNGEVCTQRGRKLRSGDIISIENESFKIV